jgi:two-component system, cell cycle sensor histidine kinase PleC
MTKKLRIVSSSDQPRAGSSLIAFEGGGRALRVEASVEAALARVVLEDFAPMAIVRLDADAFSANRNYLELVGLAEDDPRIAAHGQSLREEVAFAMREFRSAQIPGPVVIERQVPVLDGGQFRAHYFPVLDGDDRAVACAVVYYDITAHVTMTQRLHGVQSLFQDVLRSASDWVWETDANGLITFISDRITEIVAMAPGMLIGKPIDSLAMTHEDAHRWAAAAAARTPFRGIVFDVRDRDGNPRRHHLSGVPYYHLEGGRFAGFRGAGTDTSAQHAAELATGESRRQLERALEELNRQNARLDAALERAQEAARAKGDFLANMSHELRTPLNAIIGFADIISAQAFGRDPGRYVEYANDILKAGRHLLKMVDNVLEVSQRDDGAITTHREAVDLELMVREARGLVIEAGRGRGVDLRIDPPRERVLVQVDRGRALQVMVNLLSNAVKFSPDGGCAGVTIQAGPQSAAVIVWDRGPGVPADKLEQIFEPFYQVHEASYSRPHDGAGLGLAIARRLARMMDGDVIATSVPGLGSRFVAQFPLAPPR